MEEVWQWFVLLPTIGKLIAGLYAIMILLAFFGFLFEKEGAVVPVAVVSYIIGITMILGLLSENGVLVVSGNMIDVSNDIKGLYLSGVEASR